MCVHLVRGIWNMRSAHESESKWKGIRVRYNRSNWIYSFIEETQFLTERYFLKSTNYFNCFGCQEKSKRLHILKHSFKARKEAPWVWDRIFIEIGEGNGRIYHFGSESKKYAQLSWQEASHWWVLLFRNSDGFIFSFELILIKISVSDLNSVTIFEKKDFETFGWTKLCFIVNRQYIPDSGIGFHCLEIFVQHALSINYQYNAF